jgi:Tfp pilus assembly PilM family ATPase
MNFGTKDFMCLDFVRDSLRIAAGTLSSGKTQITHLVNRNISGLSDAKITESIRVLIGEMGLKKPIIIATVPSGMIITKNIEIPSRDKKEIKEIINLQAIRHTPYSRQEIVIDYIDIGTYRQSYTKVLLIIVTR